MGFAFGNGPENIDLSKGGDKGSTPRPSLPVPPANGAGAPGINKPNLPQLPTPGGIPTPPAIQRPGVTGLPAAPRPQAQPQQVPPAVARPEPTPSYEEQQYVEPNNYPQQEQPAYNNPNQGYPQQSYDQQDRYQDNGYANQQQDQYPSQDTGYNQGYPQQSYDQQDRYQDNYSQDSYPQQQPVQERNFNRPRSNMFNQPQQRPEPARQEEPEVKLDKKGRPIKQKKVKGEKKPNSFAGDRKKVLGARIAVFGILGVLVLSGLGSFLPKSTGLAAGDGPLILSKVRQDLGITAFPNDAGGAWAIGFSQTYLNYDPELREERYQELLQYAPENVIKLIDLRVATPEELATAGQDVVVTEENTEEGTEGEESTGGSDANVEETPAPETPAAPETVDIKPGSGKMVVTKGPYVVRSVMVAGGEHAVFTTRTQVNGNTWIYMEIPMEYDADTRNLAVSGSPTFVRDIQPAKVEDPNYNTYDNDDAVYKEVVEDLRGYMKAWAAGDASSIERYLLKSDGKVVATLEAQSGMSGEVIYLSSPELSVQTKAVPGEDATAADEADYRKRQARMTVRWLEPKSGLIYEQTYELSLQYTNNDWFVSDIKNIATSAGESKDRS